MRKALIILLATIWGATAAPAGDAPDIADALEAYDGGRVRESAAILEKLIARGDGEAMGMLAGFYEAGQLGRTDLPRAAALYHRAAVAGNRHAQAKYADYLSAGRGGLARDLPQALCWFTKATKAGHNWARERLAQEQRKSPGLKPPASCR